MTVVRGDAARSLMARTRAVTRQQRPSDVVSSWSHSIDIGGTDEVEANLGGLGALLRQRLIGTSLEQRNEDIVLVMTALVGNALSAPGPVTLRVSWTPLHGLLVEATDRAPAAAALLAAAGNDAQHLRALDCSSTVEQLTDAWGLRPQSTGTCVWARMTGRPAC